MNGHLHQIKAGLECLVNFIIHQFLDPKTDTKHPFLDPESVEKCQFLDSETDILGKGNYIDFNCCLRDFLIQWFRDFKNRGLNKFHNIRLRDILK